MKKRLLLLVFALLPVLAACGQSGLPVAPEATSASVLPTVTTASKPGGEPPTPTTEASLPPTTEPTEEPAVAETPAIPPDQGMVLTDPLAIELQALVVAGMSPTPTAGPDSADYGSTRGVYVIPLTTSSVDSTSWAAFSYGMRRFEPVENHFVAVYSHSESGWQELSRLELEDPDIVDQAAVQQVDVEPENTWIQVESGVGAHAGCFNLLRFDGNALHNEVSHCNSSPGAGSLEDLNGDGTLDVLLDVTDHYVFCYACGVRYINTSVKTWEGSNMVDVELHPLTDTEPEELRQLTNRAIELASHDLWKDAQATIDETLRFNSKDPTYTWDVALINVDASRRAEHVQYTGYPLLANLFYGDYPATLDILRGYGATQIFNLNSPLFKGTPAETWNEFATEYVTRTTTLQLEAQPDLAGAYFVRGWSLALLDPKDPDALADMQRAAELDPTETLFSESLAYLKEER